MHDDAGEASSLHDLSTGEYSQSSDVGHSAGATVAHDTFHLNSIISQKNNICSSLFNFLEKKNSTEPHYKHLP